MAHFVPATGRLLRYWCAAISASFRHRLYGYLKVEPVRRGEERADRAASEWTGSEVWQRPAAAQSADDGPPVACAEADAATVPRLTSRVPMDAARLARRCQRRRGSILRTTFETTRSRLRQTRADAGRIGL